MIIIIIIIRTITIIISTIIIFIVIIADLRMLPQKPTAISVASGYYEVIVFSPLIDRGQKNRVL